VFHHRPGDVGRQQATQQVLEDRFPGRAQGRDSREQGEAHRQQRHHGHQRREGEAARRLGEAFLPAAPEDAADQAALVSACRCHLRAAGDRHGPGCSFANSTSCVKEVESEERRGRFMGLLPWEAMILALGAAGLPDDPANHAVPDRDGEKRFRREQVEARDHQVAVQVGRNNGAPRAGRNVLDRVHRHARARAVSSCRGSPRQCKSRPRQ
jgi:hypothetical protein